MLTLTGFGSTGSPKLTLFTTKNNYNVVTCCHHRSAFNGMKVSITSHARILITSDFCKQIGAPRQTSPVELFKVLILTGFGSTGSLKLSLFAGQPARFGAYQKCALVAKVNLGECYPRNCEFAYLIFTMA